MEEAEQWGLESRGGYLQLGPPPSATCQIELLRAFHMWFGLRGREDGSAEQPCRHRAGLGSKVDEHNPLIAVAQRPPKRRGHSGGAAVDANRHVPSQRRRRSDGLRFRSQREHWVDALARPGPD